KVITEFGRSQQGFSYAFGNSVAVQLDGKIVGAGVAYFSSSLALNRDFALARYNGDGTLDASFGTGGKVTTDFSPIDFANSLVIQPDGKIVVAGASNVSRGFGFALVRYNSNG